MIIICLDLFEVGSRKYSRSVLKPFFFLHNLSLYSTSRSLHLELKAPTELWDRISGSSNMAQRKWPSYAEWLVERSVYSLFCGAYPVLPSQVLWRYTKNRARAMWGDVVLVQIALKCSRISIGNSKLYAMQLPTSSSVCCCTSETSCKKSSPPRSSSSTTAVSCLFKKFSSKNTFEFCFTIVKDY